MKDHKLLNMVSRILPTFDGSIHAKQAFIDSLHNLVQNNAAQQQLAVAVIKLKLIGSARLLISEENTVRQIFDRLNDEIRA